MNLYIIWPFADGVEYSRMAESLLKLNIDDL